MSETHEDRKHKFLSMLEETMSIKDRLWCLESWVFDHSGIDQEIEDLKKKNGIRSEMWVEKN